MVENAAFCIVLVDAAVFKVTDVKQDHSVLPHDCLYRSVCLQVGCAPCRVIANVWLKQELSSISLLVQCRYK